MPVTPARRLGAIPFGVALLALCALGARPAGAEDPFELRTREVPGRPIEVLTIPREDGPDALVVASVEGQPPEERRHLSVYVGGRETTTPLAIRDAVVAFDVADVDPSPGLEILLLEAGSLTVLEADGGARIARHRFDPPLPFPPRTRQFSRLHLARDWEGGGPTALLPDPEGVRLLRFADASQQVLPMPLITRYETLAPERPIYDGYARASVLWPGLALADDDGDGQLDLFAASRFELWTFRNQGGRLPTVPTRRERFAPFSFESERRHESSRIRPFIRDLDADGRADLVVHRSEGTLMSSHSTTSFHPNRGDGVSPASEPSVTLESEGAFGYPALTDLDGDGRVEMMSVAVPFGLTQVLRILARRRVEANLRVYHLPGPGIGEPVVSWETDVSYPLDFDKARILGLLPTADGDWNGDGVLDLIHGVSAKTVRILPGTVSEKGPGFGREIARQDLPTGDIAAVGDLDGDGLDDLIVWDLLDETGQVHVARNRGRLEGTPPQLPRLEPASTEPRQPTPPEPSTEDAAVGG